MRFAVFVAVVGVLVGGCSGQDMRLKGRIAAEVERSAGAGIRLAELTDFAWDRFYTFAPYTPREMVEEELGFAWPEAPPATSSEMFMLLVFVEDERVVRYLLQDRKQADFDGLHRPGGYTPAQAVFAVVDHGSDLPVRYELTHESIK